MQMYYLEVFLIAFPSALVIWGTLNLLIWALKKIFKKVLTKAKKYDIM